MGSLITLGVEVLSSAGTDNEPWKEKLYLSPNIGQGMQSLFSSTAITIAVLINNSMTPVCVYVCMYVFM